MKRRRRLPPANWLTARSRGGDTWTKIKRRYKNLYGELKCHGLVETQIRDEILKRNARNQRDEPAGRCTRSRWRTR
jgi:hypothetical protein